MLKRPVFLSPTHLKKGKKMNLKYIMVAGADHDACLVSELNPEPQQISVSEEVFELESELDFEFEKNRRTRAIQLGDQIQWRQHYRILRRHHESKAKKTRKRQIRRARRNSLVTG